MAWHLVFQILYDQPSWEQAMSSSTLNAEEPWVRDKLLGIKCTSYQNEAFLVAQIVNNLPTVQKTCVQSLGQEDLLQKRMATHSSIHAWTWTSWILRGQRSLASHSPRGHKEADTAEATNANSNIRMLTLGFRSSPDGIFSSHTNKYDCEFHLERIQLSRWKGNYKV